MKLFALLLFLLVCNEAVLITATMPNILMFVIDDLGWNDTSYKGSDILTPSIDKLASQLRNPPATVLRAKTVLAL